MFCCCERTLGRKQSSSINNLSGSYFNAEELKLSGNRKPGTFYVTGDLRTSKFRVPKYLFSKHFTGCLKSSFLYFIRLYCSKIGIGKQIA